MKLPTTGKLRPLLVPALLLALSATANAQPAVELPAETDQVTLTKVSVPELGKQASSTSPFMRETPDFVLKLGRPMNKLCFFIRAPAGVEVWLLSGPSETPNGARGQRRGRCIDKPALTTYVWVGIAYKPATEGPYEVDFGFYDPNVTLDYFFAFPATVGDSLHSVFPVMKTRPGFSTCWAVRFPPMISCAAASSWRLH